MEWYNNEHRHSGINYVTPSQRHMGLDQEILRKRKEVYGKSGRVTTTRKNSVIINSRRML